MTTEDHDHSEFEVATNLVCPECNEIENVCAMCGKPMHVCAQRLPKGFRKVEEFPDYMVNVQASVRHIKTGRYCLLARVAKNGAAMISIRQNEKTYTRSAQDLRDKAFGKKTE